MSIDYNRTLEIIREMKEFYKGKSVWINTTAYFDLASKAVEADNYGLSIIDDYTLQEILLADSFFKSKTEIQNMTSMFTDLDTIDASYNEVTEVWDTIKELLSKLLRIKEFEATPITSSYDSEHEISIPEGSPKTDDNSNNEEDINDEEDELEKIYLVTFLEENLLQDTIVSPDGSHYIEIPNPMLISEKDIVFFSKCGGGFEDLKFVGYLKRNTENSFIERTEIKY